ncbi:hypothetical protein JZ785_08245 [Alicyclobacillus curvatus]|nr:hypothetical protein JZ785_08245 [Alicyclobacillus curvatus]
MDLDLDLDLDLELELELELGSVPSFWRRLLLCVIASVVSCRETGFTVYL